MLRYLRVPGKVPDARTSAATLSAADSLRPATRAGASSYPGRRRPGGCVVGRRLRVRDSSGPWLRRRLRLRALGSSGLLFRRQLRRRPTPGSGSGVGYIAGSRRRAPARLARSFVSTVASLDPRLARALGPASAASMTDAASHGAGPTAFPAPGVGSVPAASAGDALNSFGHAAGSSSVCQL